jgi:hypothetical protein
MTDAPTERLLAAPAPDQAGADPARLAAAGVCRSCSAPLAADQRYCLACGTRVAAPRVDWAATLAGPSAALPAGDGGRGPSRWATILDRVGGPMGAAAVVLVALGVGFLLGQGSGGPSGPATIVQRPPIVNVQGGGSAPSTDAGAADTGSGGSGGGTKRAAARGGSGSTAGVPKAPTQDDAGGDLNRLRAQPEDQATGGTAPRRDDKAAGGGTEAETIG